MLTRLLTGNNLPQTLLLTALTLLIAAATTMLACGPAAQPTPADSNARLAAPQGEGNGAEPAVEPEEPTATTTVAKRAVMDAPTLQLDATSATPTPEVAVAIDTPTPEPTAMPTPEPATPTPAPTPEVLTMAGVPVTVTPEEVTPQETGNTESPQPTATPTPTPRPTVCLTRPDGPDICVQEPPRVPEPTPKYPNLGEHYNRLAVEAEESAASQAGGVSGQSEVEISTEYVEITLSNKASTDATVTWLIQNQVPTIPNWRQGDKGYIVYVGDDNIFAVIPTSLLGPLSMRKGFTGVINGCHHSIC